MKTSPNSQNPPFLPNHHLAESSSSQRGGNVRAHPFLGLGLVAYVSGIIIPDDISIMSARTKQWQTMLMPPGQLCNPQSFSLRITTTQVSLVYLLFFLCYILRITATQAIHLRLPVLLSILGVVWPRLLSVALTRI